MLNAFRYSVFGIPSRDFENTWFDVTETAAQINQSHALEESQPTTTHVCKKYFLLLMLQNKL